MLDPWQEALLSRVLKVYALISAVIAVLVWRWTNLMIGVTAFFMMGYIALDIACFAYAGWRWLEDQRAKDGRTDDD